MTHHQLPDLPYDFNALEPAISAQIMELHYSKHHQGYVNNLNIALEQYEKAEQKGDLNLMISLQPAIRFNGGGHLNHSIFWQTLAPINKGGGIPPEGNLAEAIECSFGSYEKFIEKLNHAAMGIQGSGWAWLGYDRSMGRLVIATCPNQDPLSAQGYQPLLGVDVWEHAYYLQYKNLRADYLKNFYKVVNWKNVQEKYREALL